MYEGVGREYPYYDTDAQYPPEVEELQKMIRGHDRPGYSLIEDEDYFSGRCCYDIMVYYILM